MCRNNKAFGVIFLIIISSLFTSQTTYANQMEEEKVLNTSLKSGYQTVEVKSSDYVEAFTMNSIEWVYLRNDKLSNIESKSIFVEYLVKDDQLVKKGDPLYSYQIPSDNIGLEENQILLDRKKSNYQVNSTRMKQTIAAKKQEWNELGQTSLEAQILYLSIQKLESEYEQYEYQTEKSVKALEDTIQEIKSDIELQYRYAPYDGIVNTKDSIKAGQEVKSDTVLIEIYDPESAVLGVNVSGNNKLRYLMEVSVTGINNRKDDRETVYTGKVVAADTVLNSKARTGMIFIAMEDTNLAKAFQRANLSAETVRVQNVLVIPLAAVENDNGSRYVYVLDEDGKIRKQYITGRDNRTDMWVYNGLSIGQSIVIE